VRKMPQIPRDVFFGGATAATEEPVEAQPAPVAPPPQVARPVEEDKIQVTVYLSPQAAKHLEALKFHLLNEHNVKVSKSALAEYAIMQLGDDLASLAESFGAMQTSIGER
jgi:hypothetical protein